MASGRFRRTGVQQATAENTIQTLKQAIAKYAACEVVLSCRLASSDAV